MFQTHLSNTSNRANEEALTIQQNPNTSPDIQAGLAQAEGNPLVIQAVSQKEQATLDDASDDTALAIAQDATKDEKERMDAAESIINDAKRDEAYLAIVQNEGVDYNNRLDAALFIKNEDTKKAACNTIIKYILKSQNVLEILNDLKNENLSDDSKNKNVMRLNESIYFASRIKNDEIKNEVLIKICEQWPKIESKYNGLRCNINLFNRLYSFASSDDTKADLIIAITNHTTLDKEFRKQIIKDKVPAERLKTKLLNCIENGISFQPGDTKSGAN